MHVTLGVLKKFGKANKNLLSFQMKDIHLL